MHRHTYVARDYMAELNQWAHEDYFFGNVHKMQLPFTAVSGIVECRIVLFSLQAETFKYVFL